MNHIAQSIFRAIHEGKWISIEYRNQNEETTNYWIAVNGINVKNRTLSVEGFHLVKHTIGEFKVIYLDSILSASVVEASYCKIRPELVRDIEEHPEKYEPLFGQPVNLKILNYLADCSRLDTELYECDYALIKKIDGGSFRGREYFLNDEQFSELVQQFQRESSRQREHKAGGSQNGGAARAGNHKWQYRQLALNELSIPVRGRKPGKEALYVMAYRRLNLDVRRRTLRADDEVTVCREFTVGGEQESIRKYMDPADYDLLNDFDKNRELIKDRITAYNRLSQGVDDRPYIIALARDIKVDLNNEYQWIAKSLEEGEETWPIKAFFGKMTARPVRRREYPLALLEKKVNLDQLLVIHNAIKYPVTYVQGPPGTGKSYTIINTIITAFFNEKTVLLASYNNHPIDTVVDDLKGMEYKNGIRIPFPVIRLGNAELTKAALKEMRELYEDLGKWKVFEGTLDKNRDEKTARAKRLTKLLREYEETLNLREKKEAIECLMNTNRHLTFQADLQGRQLAEVDRELDAIGEITNEQALALLDDDEKEFRKYLHFTSIRYLKRMAEPKNEDLRNILEMEDEDEQVKAFNQYIGEPESLKRFLRIFPVVATTCISAHKLGTPQPYFDMTIMDEASQCNTAMSLVPILRGKNLMLVGDPQQLSPVILLDEKDNAILRQRYRVPDEYDYAKNSIYKAFLANDAVSEEILLRHHYRCCPAIISFNNKKYYNNKLIIENKKNPETPLVCIDVADNRTDYKNTAPEEAERILEYVRKYQDKKIGVITPFANQREYISRRLEEENIKNVSCGTVHAFQGDQQDIILFSTALTDQTSDKTYNWLKNNRELINVATSRAIEKLVLVTSTKNLERLHQDSERDDMYELAQYVRKKGTYEVTPDEVNSRALGIKPYSTQTEEAFLVSLNHALDNILNNGRRCKVRKEVAISQVFQENLSHDSLFYNGRFDFVIYEQEYGGKELPILAIELDGMEHQDDELVKKRDREKANICRAHGFELIRVENSYARRYYYIKEILEEYFKRIR